MLVSGRIRRRAPFRIGHYDGTRLDFDGGVQSCLHVEDSKLLGVASGFIWDGDRNDGPLLDIGGAGVVATGGCNLLGLSQDSGPWRAIDHAKDLCALGILISGSAGAQGLPEGLDNGASIFGPLFIGGCRRGIQLGNALDENNADNCQFPWIACSHVDNLVCFKNRQSVSNEFGHIRQLADGTPAEQRAFELLRFEAGGKCTVNHVEINAGLVVRAIRSDWNTGFCYINTVSTDPAGGKSFRLFDGAPDPTIGAGVTGGGLTEPCPFILTVGKVWNGIDWRESSSTAGYMVDAYAGQQVTIEGGGLFESKNGPSIRLRGKPGERAVCTIRGAKFDSKKCVAPMLSKDSRHYLFKCIDCLDRAGDMFSVTCRSAN